MADTRDSARNVLNDIADGFFQISHNSFAMLGLALVFVMITLTGPSSLLGLLSCPAG